jgi:hypothetical protein
MRLIYRDRESWHGKKCAEGVLGTSLTKLTSGEQNGQPDEGIVADWKMLRYGFDILTLPKVIIMGSNPEKLKAPDI